MRVRARRRGFATGLRVHPRLECERWRPAAALLVVGMPMTVLALAARGVSLAGLSLGAAILLASARRRTPVLAGDIGVAPPGDEETRDRGVAALPLRADRRGGAHDGFVFPLFLVGVLVLGEGGTGWLGNWVLTDVVYGIGVAVVVGAAEGYGLAALLLRRAHGG